MSKKNTDSSMAAKKDEEYWAQKLEQSPLVNEQERERQSDGNVLTRPIVLNPDQLVLNFTESLANMLASGIPLTEALDIFYQEEQNKVMKQTVKEIIIDLKKGKPFYESLSKSYLFPPLYTAMVMVSEETGRLKETMTQLLVYIRGKVELKQKVFSVLYYPAFLLVLSFGTIAYLVIYVLPRLLIMFKNFDSDLPAITLFLMSAIEFFQSYWLFLLAGLAAGLMALFSYGKTKKGSLALEKLTLKIPVLGKIYGLNLNVNLFRPLKLLLRNRVNLLTSLEVLKRSFKSALMAQTLNAVIVSLKKGKKLTAELEKRSFLSISTIQMLTIGEKSGKLSEIIENIETAVSAKMEETVRRSVVLIEPLLILFIGLIVGFIVIAALLPIQSLSTMVR